jgi:hypothetical protein
MDWIVGDGVSQRPLILHAQSSMFVRGLERQCLEPFSAKKRRQKKRRQTPGPLGRPTIEAETSSR